MLTGIVPRAFSAYTVIGCVSDDTGYLYTGPAGVNAPAGYSYTEWYYQNGWRSRTVNVAGSPNAGSPAYETTPVVNEGLLGTGIYCQSTYLGPCVIRTRSQCRQCTGPYDYNRNQNNTDMWYEQAGKLYGYNTCQVPIDDYAGLLLVLVAGLGFFVVRKSM